MTIAAVGAVILGELGEAASLAFLFSISEALEDYAMTRTRHGLRALLDFVPDQITIRRTDGDIQIEPDELVVGDIMVIGPGERIATDGIIRTGRSTLDLSAITGESVPVEVDVGRDVLAAAINGSGVLDIEVTATTSDSSLARIVHKPTTEETTMTYTRTITLDLPVSDAIDRVKSALKDQGFGTLTEIDLQATMKDKLDVDVEPYIILGACNPELAYRALQADRSIGALLPCNVVVRGDGERTIVDALDPAVMSGLAEGLDDVAEDAAQRIDAALASLSSEP